MKYEINKPESELTEGYFNIILKYAILFFVFWGGGCFFLFFITNRRRHSGGGLGEKLFQYPELLSVLIAIVVIAFFVQFTLNKIRLGLITSFEIDETNQNLRLTLLNTINGSIRSKEIDFDKLSVAIENREGSLFGKQRIFSIYEKGILISRLNIDLTSWCRHPDIDNIVTKLKEL